MLLHQSAWTEQITFTWPWAKAAHVAIDKARAQRIFFMVAP
jgi:hypothetical protein